MEPPTAATTQQTPPHQQQPPRSTFTGRSLDQQVDNDISPNNSNYSNLSNSSSSTTSASDNSSSSTSGATENSSSSSPPHYSDNVARQSSGAAGGSGAPALPSIDLLPQRQGSGSSSTKTCEVDLGDEERDTFSPVTSNQCSPCEGAVVEVALLENGGVNGTDGIEITAATAVVGVDNKIFEGSTAQKFNGLPSLLPSKEEKQRQNEEIVCMETSTISSETGSWESVYPQQAQQQPQELQASTSQHLTARVADHFFDNLLDHGTENILPKLRERTYSTGAAVTADTSSLFKGISSNSLLRDFDKQPMSTSGTSACFIDASSLRDEDEVLSFPSLDGQQHAIEVEEEKEEPDQTPAVDEELLRNEGGEEESPTKQLEEFHKAFAKCRNKTKPEPEPAPDDQRSYQTNSSVSSHSGGDSPEKIELDPIINLSDEEKLWKREHNENCNGDGQVEPPTGDAVLGVDAKEQQPQMHEDATEASVSIAADVDSSDSSVSGGRLQRNKQLPFNFQHNMQQFSIHPLGTSPKFTAHHMNSNSLPGHTTQHHVAAHTLHNDLSYTTDYSSSSPAPSLVWSEHEQRSSLPSSAGGMHHRHRNGDEKTGHGTHLPDTPHNSIIHIEPMSSDTSSIHRDFTISSSLSHHRDSGAYCSDATDSPIPMPRTPKRSKFDEANPIVSGGASIDDFNIKQCESPPIKRRTDTCPIVSGGFVSLGFETTRPLHDDDDDDNDDDGDIEGVELRSKPISRKPISGIASWVVDMSDCRPERRKSTSSTSSIEAGATAKFRERSDSASSHKSGCGFYVSLNDMDKKPKEKPVKPPQIMSKSYTGPKSTGFYVNLSQSEYQIPLAEEKRDENNVTAAAEADKKNMFSIFIGFGDSNSSSNSSKQQQRNMNGSKKEPFNLAQHLSSSLTSANKRLNEDATTKSSTSSTETLMAKSSHLRPVLDEGINDEINDVGESKSLDYKCNLDPPVTVAAIRRISAQQRSQSDAIKRHSWGTNQSHGSRESTPAASGDYKRSISLTANGKDNDGGSSGLMSIIDKIPIISKASSLSIDSSLSPYDEYTGSKSGFSTSSNNSARNSMSGPEREEDVCVFNGGGTKQSTRTKKRRRDVQINETFDKSSVASVTSGLLSKDLSPASTTDTDDLTFQQDEELALREVALQQQQPVQALQLSSSSNRSSAIIMETIIEAKEISSPKKNGGVSSLNNGHTMETLHATIEKQKMLLETVNEHTEVEKSTFVKLSDMDKPVKHDLNSPDSMSKSAGNHRQMNRLFRDDTKTTRPHSWSMTRSTGNSFLNITNSVDNLRSLSRLFPHFSKEFSNSLPNDIVLDQMDYIQTDLSTDSSLASSFSRSGMDESSISCRQPRRLGEDLLKMFLQEIATDMIVEVHGRRIRAHKCILRSRCQYFAAMLAGNGNQSVVSLQGYSYSAVHFALCHIYSGASHPPDGISLMELAALADLLGLEGLKEVTAHALKTNYCHNFHKPCSGCIDGILQVLPVALNHALDDLYRKCLRWTCRHYLRVWPERQFAQLPADILGRCRQQIVAYLTSETVLDTVLDCDHLLGQLSAYRWGGICENLVRDILDAAYSYISDHFASLIASDSFLSLGHDRSRHIPRLEGLLLRTAASLTADQACRSYQRITRLNTVLQAKIIQMPANLGELAKELQGLQEEDLDWDPEYIRLVSALLSAVEQCLIRQCSRAMRVTAWQRMDLDLRKKIQTLARLTEPLDMKRNSKPVSKAFSFGGSTRSQDLIQVKLAIQAHSKRALAQDTQLYKATQTHDNGASNGVLTTERGVQANNDLREGNSKLLKSNSRAHMPQAYRASSQSVTERNSINLTHRRTQSEAPALNHKSSTQQRSSTNEAKSTAPMVAPPKSASTAKLSDVRPRYLEPRKARVTGPVRSATSSNVHATNKGKGLHISSSESSRNSSPAARRNATKIGNKSTNMSMDSLASPARRARSAPRGKSSDTERFSDINVDSMAESMKSSVITNKTVSHESLSGTGSSSNRLIRSNQLNGIGGAGRYAPTKASAAKATQKALLTATNRSTRQLKQQHHINSNGSSPSSVQTTKSAASRLSSVSSTQSTRELFKQRSISVPAGGDSTTTTTTSAGGSQQKQRHSFLSAKSREILAKRAEKNKLQQKQQQEQQQHKRQQQQQQQQVHSSGDESSQHRHVRTGPLRSSSHSAVHSMMAQQQNHLRHSMPSNIPTRRPNTLHLKKTTSTTNGFSHQQMQQQQHNKVFVANTNAKNNKLVTTNGVVGGSEVVLKAAHAVKQKLDLLIDATMHDGSSPPSRKVEVPQIRVESKLERSSTFCKDSADLDLDMNELQIIE